ncbi:GumC family protein [Bradyrhizobium sp. SYSU BS000235]|uniref:GumC family protein n=1 Tax=Bradyrhizobium sp. SYSU BS000235 TaxID=3411332 RepID=UPI003C725A62
MSTKQLPTEQSSERAPDGVDFKDVLTILSRQKLWVLCVPALLCGLVLAYVLITPPAYTATAQVYVDPRDQSTPKDDTQQNSVPGDGLLLVESQLKIITSDEVLKRVIEQANLQNDPEFNGQRNPLISLVKAVLGLGSSDDRELTALRNLRRKTSTKRIDRSFVIDIMASATTRDRAAVLANAVANAYLEVQARANANFNRRLSESINSQLEKLRLEVKRGEEAVAAYKAANGLVGSRNKLVTEQELDEANTQLTIAKTRLADAQAKVKLVETVESGGAGLDSLPEAIQSGAIVQLRAKAADASREVAQLERIAGPAFPGLQVARAQLRDTDIAIKSELKRVAQAVRNLATSERTNVQNLQAKFDALKARSEANDKAIVPLRELERKADSSRTIYETFLAKAKTAEERQGIDTTNIRLISPATPPEGKSWPPTLLMLAAALLVGSTLGVALALAVDYFVAGAGNDPGTDTSGARRKRPIPPPINPSMVPEAEPQFSRLRAELPGAPAGYTIMLVRAQADAALDLAALELARAVIADRKTVVVIDADLARHRVSSVLGFDGCGGVREILASKAAIRDVLRLHKQTTMRIVPAGIEAFPPPAAAGREAIATAISQARDFDRVIIDGGELGGASSNYGLYAMVDEVVFIASSQNAPTDEASVLADILRHNQVKARLLFVEPNMSLAA